MDRKSTHHLKLCRFAACSMPLTAAPLGDDGQLCIMVTDGVQRATVNESAGGMGRIAWCHASRS
jgi:hypothetical protein